jgi:hypothetical protein
VYFIRAESTVKRIPVVAAQYIQYIMFYSYCSFVPRHNVLRVHLLFFLSKKPFPVVLSPLFQHAVYFSPSLFFQDTISCSCYSDLANTLLPTVIAVFFQDTITCSRCLPAQRHIFLPYGLNRENWRTLVEQRSRNSFSTRVGTDLTGFKITTPLDSHEKNNRSSSASCKVLIIFRRRSLYSTSVYLHSAVNFSCFTPYINPRSS